jgi:hypothetical protein
MRLVVAAFLALMLVPHVAAAGEGDSRSPCQKCQRDARQVLTKCMNKGKDQLTCEEEVKTSRAQCVSACTPDSRK